MLLGFLSLILTPALLISQETEEEDESDIEELSPFSVEAQEGWVATETLAGSRLRTDLRDVSSQIETMTIDFMEDYNVNSVEEALIYSTNVASPDDRITGNGEGFGNAQISNFSQIRGLGGGTNSREFFQVSMPTDNYNLSRVTIAAGPQPVLFGVGSPAGVLDVTMNRANFAGNKGSLSLGVDSFGGHRATLDYNFVVLDDKLAVRAAVLDEDRKMEWKPNYDRDKRVYVTALIRPFKNTDISLHYEKSRREPNRVNRFLAFDALTPWIVSGDPGYNNGPGNMGNLPAYFTRHNLHPVSIINDDGTVSDPISYRDTVEVQEPADMPTANPLDFQADGWTLHGNNFFPVATSVNFQGIARVSEHDADHFNIFIDQKILDNWYLSFGYNKEDYEENGWSAGNYNRTLRIDANNFMPDGVTPNPHFGDYYLEDRGSFTNAFQDRENWRAMTSFEYDFAQHDGIVWEILGKHRIGGLVSQDKYRNATQQGMRYRFMPNAGGSEPNFAYSDEWSTRANDRPFWRTRSYLTEANGYTAQRPNFPFDGSPVTIRDEAGQPVTLNAFDLGLTNANGARLLSSNGPQMENTETTTTQVTYQAFFWDSRGVFTWGWREDEAKSKGAEPGFANRDNPTRMFPYFQDVPWATDWRTVQKGQTKTIGGILRPIPEVAFFYNEADTFQPNIGRFDPYGNEYPGAQGDGRDYGVQLDLFDRRLSIKWNEFENTAGPLRAANTPFNRWRDPVWDVESRWRALDAVGDYPNQGEGGFRELGRALYWVMSDNTSKGRELTISASPTPNWNLRFTYADQEAIESNIGDVWFQWIDERLPVWEALNVPEGGADNPRDMDGDGVIGTWTWDTAWYEDDKPPATGGQTLSQYYYEVTVNGTIGSAVIKALDGKANEFERSRRWNFNTSYRLTEGMFQGTTVGGALRWRDAPVTGYADTTGPGGLPIIDLERPWFGSSEFYVDAFVRYRGQLPFWDERNYSLQVNVNNLMGTDSPIRVIDGVEGNALRLARREGTRWTFTFGLDL